jgi:hypothetical protein
MTIFKADERVTSVDDPQARGTVFADDNGRTALVRWDIHTNPYGVGAPRVHYELVDNLVPVGE